MALAITFAPFCNSKNFEDMKGLVDRLYNDFEEDKEHDDKSFIEFLTVGSFDDGVEENQTTIGYNNLSYIIEPEGFY